MPGAKRLEVFYASQAQEDLAYWKRTNKAVVKKIEALVEDVRQSPFAGMGKPEPLRYEWTGFWSRHITKEHRFVYKVEGDVLYVAQCRFHY